MPPIRLKRQRAIHVVTWLIPRNWWHDYFQCAQWFQFHPSKCPQNPLHLAIDPSGPVNSLPVHDAPHPSSLHLHEARGSFRGNQINHYSLLVYGQSEKALSSRGCFLDQIPIASAFRQCLAESHAIQIRIALITHSFKYSPPIINGYNAGVHLVLSA